MTTPRHDGFARRLFSHPDTAVAQLQWLVPAGLSQALDWTTLRQGPTDTADVTGRARRSDVIFEIETRGGSPLLVHVLLEHQRSPDPLMALRITEYQTRIWRAYLDHVGQDTIAALPPILPIVLYNGDVRWRGALAIEELARAPDGWNLGPYQLSWKFLLFDLSQVSDETIEARSANPHLQLGLLVLKHIRGRSAWAQLLSWAPTLLEVRGLEGGEDRVQEVLHYLFRAANPPSPEERRRVIELLPEFEGDIVTWEQQIRQEALSEGRVQGELIGIRRMLKLQLTARFGTLPTEVEARLDDADEATLEHLVKRFPSFEGSLYEFFAG